MSEATSTAESPQTTVQNNPKAEAKKVARLRMAHEGVCLKDAQAVLKQNRETKAHFAKMMAEMQGREYTGDETEGDEDVINIGDNVYNITQTAPATPAKADDTVQKTGSEQSGGITSTLAKTGVAAALAIGGAGAMAVADSVLDRLTNPPPAATAPEFVDTDTNTDTVTDFELLD